MARTRVPLVATAACLALVMAGCGSSSGSGGATASASAGTPSSSSSSSTRQVRLVAIGDSDASGKGDPTGQGWVGRYATLIQNGTGLSVKVDNQAQDGTTSDALRTLLQSSTTVQQTLQGAEIVVIGIGGADLGPGDDALSAGNCKGKACYEPLLATFATNLEGIVAKVRALSGSAVIRAVTLPNAYPGAESEVPPGQTSDLAVYQVDSERKIICGVVRKHGGECIDVARAFNGPELTTDAYRTGLLTKDPCCYASDKGQQLMAELLYKLGISPLA